VDEWGFGAGRRHVSIRPSPTTRVTETVWFSWMVPERNLLGTWYTVFRPSIGVNFVVCWSSTTPRAALGDSHLRLALASADLPEPSICATSTCSGQTLRCEEHGRRFSLPGIKPTMSRSISLRPLIQPMLTRKEPPFNHGNHIGTSRAGSRALHVARRGDERRLHRHARSIVGHPRAAPSTEARLLHAQRARQFVLDDLDRTQGPRPASSPAI